MECNISHASSLERWLKGMGYIPSDRVDVGSIGDYSLVDNVLMNYYFDDEFSKWGILDSKRIRKLTEGLISEYERGGAQARHNCKKPVRRKSSETHPGTGSFAQTAPDHCQFAHAGT